MPKKNGILHVNDVDLNVVDTGAGEPALVFLHYWGGSSSTWASVMDRLANTQRCSAIDFRGWGLSSKEATDYGLETLASDVIAVVEKLALKEFFLIGHSMGGKVAQLAASRHPKALRAKTHSDPPQETF